MHPVRLFLLCCLAAAATGCAQVSWVKTKIASGVDDYCTRVTPAERLLIRQEVNSTLEPKGHAIRVSCKGDQEQ